MLETREISAGVTKTILSVLALVAVASCARDPLAPDCFIPDPEGSGCLIPFPGASDVTSSCLTGDGVPPEGAVGADYEYDLNTATIGGTGTYSNWMATTPLPPGLTLDPDTGIISGVAEEPGNTGYPLSISVDDAITGENYTFECAEIHINERLNALGLRNEALHCIPHTASYDEMVAMLGGGDETTITCNAFSDAGGACPMGDGNGRPPPGVTFDAETCTHSGNITGDRRGTWVWMVEIEQSGATTRVPFCASRDLDTFHDITLTANAEQESDLNPGLLEFDPSMSLAFGNGTHIWDIVDPACNADPSQCNSFGFKFDVTCSPFDPPFDLNAQSSGIGINHDLTAMGPAVASGSQFEYRPFVASFEMSYCTSAIGADCDVDGADFDQNAQTQYHYDVVGFPVLGNP
jgi:Putative Ig domain